MTLSFNTLNRNQRDFGAERLFGMNGSLRDYIDYGYCKTDSFKRIRNSGAQKKKTNSFIEFFKTNKNKILTTVGIVTAGIFAFKSVKACKNLISKISVFLKN